MRIFLYESITGGGLLGEPGPLPPSLLQEGRAMASAAAEDLLAVGGLEVSVMHDRRLPMIASENGDQRHRESLSRRCTVETVSDPSEHQQQFARLARESDWSLVIAPEIDGALLRRAKTVLGSGGRLLGPSPRLIELASDKHRTAVHLARAGLPVPQGIFLKPGEAIPADFPRPAVLKRCDGAGSVDLHILAPDRDGQFPVDRPSRLERFHHGSPTSISVLAGRGGCEILPPCSQMIDFGDLGYQGGRTPLDASLVNRARNLAQRVMEALPSALGYLGIDLILGDAADGADDVVVEVNPRLTTSYVGLRVAARQNLAAAMLAIAGGKPFALSFAEEPVEFFADGRVVRSAGAT